MPLVPGVPFTNAIRDIADGDYISGSVRMLDALLIFFCIAIGVGGGFSVIRWGTEVWWDGWNNYGTGFYKSVPQWWEPSPFPCSF